MTITRTELDFFRAKLLETNHTLRSLVCITPVEYVFDGRPGAERLELAQLKYRDRRVRFLTSSSSAEVRRLAGDLPRLHGVLERAATGWRDFGGRVHRFGAHDPNFDDDLSGLCPHGRRLLDNELCEQCAADDAELDAL